MKYKIKDIYYDAVIIRKNNKNTYIRVKDFKIEITTSYFTSQKTIDKLVLNNENKLYKMLNKSVKQKKEDLLFSYLGQKYDIIIVPTVEHIIFDKDKLYANNTKQIEAYLNKKTKEIFISRYEYVLSIFKEIIPHYNLKIRSMKTRWGVCNKRAKTITLNSKLIRYDIEVIDYVIIHELAHLIHFNHSRDFWNLVSKYCPNYKDKRRILKE
jgi:predicted metal-dependent hydrolase